MSDKETADEQMEKYRRDREELSRKICTLITENESAWKAAGIEGSIRISRKVTLPILQAFHDWLSVFIPTVAMPLRILYSHKAPEQWKANIKMQAALQLPEVTQLQMLKRSMRREWNKRPRGVSVVDNETKND